MLSVTVVSSAYPVAGVKMADLPWTSQEPGTAGISLGSGESAASGAEKLTSMGMVPLTFEELEPGVTDVTCSAGAGCAARAWSDSWREDATDVVRSVVLPGPTRRTATPAMTTSAAEAAVIRTDFFLARGRPAPRPDAKRRNQSE